VNLDLNPYFTGALWTYFVVFLGGMAAMAALEPIGRFVDSHLRITKIARRLRRKRLTPEQMT
jgi:hypothetical protein